MNLLDSLPTLAGTVPAPPVALLNFDLEALLSGAGPWVLGLVCLMLFIESGVLFPFLPGDSLLFTTGLLHTQLGLSLPVLLLCAGAAAVLGDQVGYTLGQLFGRRLFSPTGRVLNTAHLDKAHTFFERYGGKALVLGRFIPIVRTFVPLAAGMAGYRYRSFAVWNISGALLWVLTMTMAGVWLGDIPVVRENIDLIAIVIVVLSVVPVVVEVLRERRRGRA